MGEWTNLKRNIQGLEEVAYYDDQMRYDLNNLDDINHMTLILHACYSGGFIEDLKHVPNRLLISSCGEVESSTPYGPLFCEWLNERQYKIKIQNINFTFESNIANADRNIANDPYNGEWLGETIKTYYCNNYNDVISLYEMFFNSIASSCIDVYKLNPENYYKPTLIKGVNCYEQIYL